MDTIDVVHSVEPRVKDYPGGHRSRSDQSRPAEEVSNRETHVRQMSAEQAWLLLKDLRELNPVRSLALSASHEAPHEMEHRFVEGEE
jgi:hypothetical protein